MNNGVDGAVLVMDVMKMELPITAPCAGTVSLKEAVMDKVATGDTVAGVIMAKIMNTLQIIPCRI